MPESPPPVLLDTNVFVAAIKTPRRPTKSLRLLLRFVEEDVRLVGNDLLATEYLRYAQLFPSAMASSLAAAVLDRMDLIAVEDRFIRACSAYFQSTQLADLVNAATCLQTGAILVSNDRDFDSIHQAGLIQRLTLSQAIRRWAPSNG